jgi:hypothetical protein
MLPPYQWCRSLHPQKLQEVFSSKSLISTYKSAGCHNPYGRILKKHTALTVSDLTSLSSHINTVIFVYDVMICYITERINSR